MYAHVTEIGAESTFKKTASHGVEGTAGAETCHKIIGCRVNSLGMISAISFALRE
jgi:hypothetical protein